ncbi:MAG: hypothetical protein Q4F66_08230 [Clostridium sp.]|nr:hypothetical protein [Clostridium sp.]
MIAILTADLDDLCATLKTMLQIDEKDRTESTNFYVSKLCNDSIIFANMGWQKVEVAKTIADLNAHYDLTAVIGTNTVASLSCEDAPIGTLGICTNSVQYDVDYSELGYPVGYLNLLNTVILKSNQTLVRLASMAAKKCDFCSHCGKFISADQFVASTENAEALQTCYNCEFIDCNAAPLLQMCRFYHIPGVVIGGVSDYADDDAVSDYKCNKDAAALAALETAVCLAHILSNRVKKHK